MSPTNEFIYTVMKWECLYNIHMAVTLNNTMHTIYTSLIQTVCCNLYYRVVAGLVAMEVLDH